jgi:hypothetical protein
MCCFTDAQRRAHPAVVTFENAESAIVASGRYTWTQLRPAPSAPDANCIACDAAHAANPEIPESPRRTTTSQ